VLEAGETPGEIAADRLLVGRCMGVGRAASSPQAGGSYGSGSCLADIALHAELVSVEQQLGRRASLWRLYLILGRALRLMQVLKGFGLKIIFVACALCKFFLLLASFSSTPPFNQHSNFA